jgi:hypothetical protein
MIGRARKIAGELRRDASGAKADNYDAFHGRARSHYRAAQKEGKRLGRPPVKEALKTRIIAALKAPERTEGVRKIARRFGVNASTVQNISQQLGPFDGTSANTG